MTAETTHAPCVCGHGYDDHERAPEDPMCVPCEKCACDDYFDAGKAPPPDLAPTAVTNSETPTPEVSVAGVPSPAKGSATECDGSGSRCASEPCACGQMRHCSTTWTGALARYPASEFRHLPVRYGGCR